MWNLVEDELVRFEVNTERAWGSMPLEFDHSEMIQGDYTPSGGNSHLWKCELG